jgi:asparagine synthase (glutamine-hydrolysing)
MCGICGKVALDRAPVDRGPVEAMLERLVHRGPDSAGLLEAPGIVAGIRRLAVIDVAGGDQPISNEDGTVSVVLNGEIYNFRELRETLEACGHRFRTRSDTEVIVHLWEEDGAELVHRLNGMFAFCLHDRRTGETLLARDPLGIKPLYWSERLGTLSFASEIAAIASSEIDHDALIELFCLQFLSGDATLYRGIHKLLPGHTLSVRDGRIETRRYWKVPVPAPREDVDDRTVQAELRELLEGAVRLERVADVPLGVFLSGGLDSSIVTALLSRISERPVETFSVGFADTAALDERAFAREAAERYGTEHHEIVVSPIDIASKLPELVRHLGEPVLDPALIPTYLLSRFARERVTVVLTGEGADELFGGYKRYAYQKRFGWLGALPGTRQLGRGALGDLLPRRIEQALGAVSEDDPASSHLEWASVLGTRVAQSLFDRERFEAYEARVTARFAPYFHGKELRLADQLRADQSEWLPHNLLAKVDRATMAASLEARVPFLERPLVEWAAGLPDAQRIRGSVTKHVLREAFRDQLPPRVLARPKHGFDLPLAAWIRGPLRPLVEEQLAPASLTRWPGLDATAVRSMVDRHLAAQQDFGLPLFNLLSVMLFIDGCADRPRALR